jgi:hypothetical protein
MPLLLHYTNKGAGVACPILQIAALAVSWRI